MDANEKNGQQQAGNLINAKKREKTTAAANPREKQRNKKTRNFPQKYIEKYGVYKI